jgi:hypothetical protein
LHFIFDGNQRQSFFWLAILVFNVVFSIYWSTAMYNDWQQNMILTTVATSALEIRNIDFPSVTFCLNGFYPRGIQVTKL